MYRWIVIACLAGFTLACSSPSDDAENVTEKKTENVWQGQVDTLEKARGVEKTLMDAQKKRDEAMRQQE
ncbi:hypothetical protein MNBD_GAMMA14-2450 [hydrothermal vent metagenome]|uniref:Uncharacterized protein n=1 Tax=hydrothermal vent metagenome TaxID=652676 RepID=A0A3B0Z2N0_9ZZZZ